MAIIASTIGTNNLLIFLFFESQENVNQKDIELSRIHFLTFVRQKKNRLI